MPWVFNPFTGKLDQTAAAGGGSQVNSDWNSTSGVSQILNKPTIPAAQVNSDWNATSGVSQILNKPSLATVATSGSASDLSTGTLPLARLDALVSRDNINNSFTVGQTITGQANTSALTASYSVTGDNTTALVNLTGTWNTTGAATGILLNITDTASAATSRLLDLQVGGVTQFAVSKSSSASATVAQIRFDATGTHGFSTANNTLYGIGRGKVGFGINTSFGFFTDAVGFTSSVTSAGSDLFLTRDAANILAQRNGTAAQAFRLFGTFTDASNGRRLDITSTTGGIFTLTATGNGTGASGNVLKLTAPVLIPASSVTLATNGDLAFEATSNTSLTIRYRGSDGTTRSASLTLA